MPDYQIQEWNESNSPMDLPYVEEFYRRKSWHSVSDYVRLYAIYCEGGIYFDTDIEVVKSFDPILSANCFLGFQPIFDIFRQKRENAHWVNNAVIGSIPGHRFTKRCMDFLAKEYGYGKRTYFASWSTRVTTIILENMGLSEYGMQIVGDVKLYPTEYFYPYPWWGKYNPDCVKENTYCIHHWEMSWRNEFLIWLMKPAWSLLDRILPRVDRGDN